MSTDSNKDKLFSKLIARQRTGSSTHQMTLMIDGRLITGTEELSEAWAEYFSKLSTPDVYPRTHIEEHVEDIQQIVKNAVPDPVTIDEVTKAIAKLNRGKAADPLNLGSVHIAPHIAELYTAMLEKCHISEVPQTGTMITIPKKGNDPRPSNYRGTTLTPIMAKIFEHILLARDEHLISSKQSNMQIGFTAGTSPALGSLMFTEAIAEAKDKRQPLYAAALDTMKAFDTVWHESLLRKLYIRGMAKSITLVHKAQNDPEHGH